MRRKKRRNLEEKNQEVKSVAYTFNPCPARQRSHVLLFMLQMSNIQLLLDFALLATLSIFLFSSDHFGWISKIWSGIKWHYAFQINGITSYSHKLLLVTAPQSQCGHWNDCPLCSVKNILRPSANKGVQRCNAILLFRPAIHNFTTFSLYNCV